MNMVHDFEETLQQVAQ